MSFDKIEVRVFSGPDSVQVGSNTEPDIVYVNNGPKGDKGDKGATGATGAAGPNSVTSATTSDGTCELFLNLLSSGNSDITYQGIGVAGASGANAGVFGQSWSGNGVNGQSNSGYGVYGDSATGTAVYAASTSGTGLGIFCQSGKIISGNNATTEVFSVANTGVMQATGLNITGTSFTYGAGAAAAHRTALGVSASGDTVLKSAYTPAHSLLVQQSGTGSPSSLSVGNNTILGRASGGGSEIAALSASDARTVLGLGTIATQSASNVAITGGTAAFTANSSVTGYFTTQLSGSTTGKILLGAIAGAGRDFPGVWFGTNTTTPSTSNYGFLYDSAAGTILNTPSGQSFFLRVGNTNALTIDSTLGVGIGTTTPNAKAILDLTSTTRGFLPPRMTTAQRDAITSVPAGLMVYNTTTNKLNFHNGTAWESVTSA
jgi:hypothetical protein